MTTGIDPEFAAELAQRKAEVEAVRAEADEAWIAFRGWVLQGWMDGKGSAAGIAAELGVSRARLYQVRDRHRELGRIA